MADDRSDRSVQPENSGRRSSWKDLLSSQGASLWTIRQKILGPPFGPSEAEHRTKDNQNAVGPKYIVLPMVSSRPPNFVQRLLGRGGPGSTVAIVTCPHLFSQLELEQDERCPPAADPSKAYHGFDKPDSRGQVPRPLTRCTHDEWTRQRKMVQQAFSNLPHRSLEAAKRVPLDDILKKYTKHGTNGTFLVEWKQVAVTVANHWVVHLFQGREHVLMEDRLLELWKVSRSVDPVPESVMKIKRQALIQSLIPQGQHSTTREGVMDSLFKCGLSCSEAQDNAINAMIAAMDAAQSLLFWTMWNLQRSNYWQEAKTLVSSDNSPRIFNSDLEQLAAFKKASTKGDRVDYSQLSFLGRALCETVRVFPPVWTLPRTWPCESRLVNTHPNTRWSKLDVTIVNDARCPQDWDPNNVSPSYIASFGLGRRHCPAGTAALHAVYFFLHAYIKKFESFEENVTNQAMDSCRLLPTLSVVGPQYFRVTQGGAA